MVITVTNNTVTTGSGTLPTIQASDGLTGDDYQVFYKNEDGEAVANPSEPGSYEVWVKFPDGSNYRHPDGSSEAQVGTFTVADALPTLYTVAFAGGEGAEDAMAQLEAVGGSILTLPTCGFSRGEEYQFTGWLYDGKTYQPGDHFTMPGQDVTFTAQWQTVFAVSVTIKEETSTGEQPAEGAVVSLWLGANKIDETTTQTDGAYTFGGLIPGIYNLVVTKDVRTVTSKVAIKDKDAVCSATLPKGATNSIVKVTTGSPDIVVGNLDTVFEQPYGDVYTETDAQTVAAGGKVEITFIADEKQKGDTAIDNDMEQIAEKKDDAVTVGLVMDYKLIKSVTGNNQTTTTNITQSNVLLEVLLPLPTELQGKAGYSVYRVHDNEVQELTTTPNALGEYVTVSSDKTGLTLYVKCFSTYAIGYTEFTGGSGGGASTPTYSPNIVQPEHGSVSIKPSFPKKGDTVTVTAAPEEGYTVNEVVVTDSAGKPVAVTPNGDGTYTFTQPAGAVTITVTFRPMTSPSECPRDESCPMAPFTDADRSFWYHDGIHYCVENGLMVGTSETTFAPNAATTRGMIVTILWRLEGSPMVSHSMDYEDVKPEDWYGEAVRWADSTGVAAGYGSGRFGPDDPVTREQLAVMLWRYAGSPHADGSLSSFADGAQTSGWAQTAMIWAVDQGLIAGVSNDRLDPGGQAARAQTATILMRFAEHMAQ